MTDKSVSIAEKAHRLNVQQFHAARRVRDMGRARYLALNGAWKFGLIFTAVMMLAVTLFTPTESRAPLVSAEMPRYIGWWLLLWPVGAAAGVLVAVRAWRGFERYWFPILDGEWPE